VANLNHLISQALTPNTTPQSKHYSPNNPIPTSWNLHDKRGLHPQFQALPRVSELASSAAGSSKGAGGAEVAGGGEGEGRGEDGGEHNSVHFTSRKIGISELENQSPPQRKTCHVFGFWFRRRKNLIKNIFSLPTRSPLTLSLTPPPRSVEKGSKVERIVNAPRLPPPPPGAPPPQPSIPPTTPPTTTSPPLQ